MYASMNFITKSELRKAVLKQLPVVLISPELGAVAVNGRERVEGPWPGTRPPLEEIRAKRCRGGKTKLRERVKPWHADVLCQDARIVEVLS